MLVVPLRGDKICTVDDSEPKTVTSYTSLKDEPAVYVSAGSSKEPFIYFADIVEINGVKVEFQKDSKVFSALGPLRRKFNLPQPGDEVKINLVDVPFKKEDQSFKVASIKLHSKKYGVARGLLICNDDSCFPLNEPSIANRVMSRSIQTNFKSTTSIICHTELRRSRRMTISPMRTQNRRTRIRSDRLHLCKRF
jgi:hypothetical protein